MAKRTQMKLETLKKIHDTIDTLDNGRKNYTDDFKKLVIDFHYQSGMSPYAISEATDIHYGNIIRWKRIYGTDQTAFVHGKNVRMDVRTKASAVRDHLVHNIGIEKLASDHKVSHQTINTWILKYKDSYEQLLDAPDGIPYIVAEKKMIYGMSNVDKIRNVLQQQHNELLDLISSMHMTGRQAELMREVAEETLAKEDDLVAAAEKLSENGIEIK